METLNQNIINKEKRPIKILQIGEGNFLRGFCDYFFYRLNCDTDFNGSVCMVQPRNSHKIDRFNKQDCLYNVITEGICEGELVSYSGVIDCIDNVIDPYENYSAYLDMAKNSDLKIFLSNTTENGIIFDSNDNDLTKTPNSFPAKLLAFLKTRYEYFNGNKDAGLYILPCELIENNADTLKEILVKLAKINNLEQNFIDWMLDSNKFCNTLVDRIVPGFPKEDLDKWTEKWGYEDNLCVKGEVYHLWAIEGDKSLLDVLPFDKTDLNIIITDDIKPYKELKVKILNGSHTFLLPIVYQLGYRIVNKTINEDIVKKIHNRFLQNEVMPSIKLDENAKEQFKNDVIARFSNPTINHEWQSIMLNSMSKFKARVIPSLSYYANTTGKLPEYSLFSFAALISLYKMNYESGFELFSDEDSHISMWKDLFSGNYSNEEIVKQALTYNFWENDFLSTDKCVKYVTSCYEYIAENGMLSAVKHFLL